jgi:nitrite reductase (NO-forming)
MTASAPVTAEVTGMSARARWHRRAALIPLAYLAALAVVALVHPWVPAWRWLGIHLLLLGAVTNAILVWSAHFTGAILRLPAPAHRRADVAQLTAHNAGVIAVLASGVFDRPWLGVAGAVAVFAAVVSQLLWLAWKLRTAVPSRFAVTVRYYLAAAAALLAGIPAGAWMLVVDDDTRPRLLLFHAHVNLLGWVTLTVLGTVLTFWPTVLRTRMTDGAVAASRTALPTAVTGLAVLAVGVLVWWPLLAAGGLTLFAVAVALTAGPAWRSGRAKPPASFAAWSIAAAGGWLVVALLVDARILLTASTAAEAADRYSTMLTPLLIGFVAQVLLGSLAYLLPMVLGGGPAAVRNRTAALDRYAAQRVSMANAALAVFLLPVGPYIRITTSLLILAALVQFLVPVIRMLLTARRQPVTPPAPPATPQPATSGPRHLGGFATGLALVLIAVLVGAAAQRMTTGTTPVSAAAGVTATGHTTTVAVTADGMRFHPDRVTVPAGDRLVIEFTNKDRRRHDLVLATGAKTSTIGPDDTTRLDAGIIGTTLEGWCSLPGHRQSGMTLTITTTGQQPATKQPTVDGEHTTGDVAATAPSIDAMAAPSAGFTARDAAAPTIPASRFHRLDLHIQEVQREVAPGVVQQLWTFNGTAPGPVLRGRIGDTFEITLINDGSIDHGIDFHAGALSPDEPMRPINPGERLVYRFTATKAGIWMYHCSTMPMLHHIGNGMYGAVIIDPPDLPAVDHEYVLVQSELYLGADGHAGDLAKMQAERPDAVVFNGYVAQYAHRPLTARAGDRVRFWVLNAGPNRTSAFHIVGAQSDTVWREGSWQLRPGDPGAAQVLDLSPAAGGFVETVLPEPGHYPFVSHVMVDAERGARGVIAVR